MNITHNTHHIFDTTLTSETASNFFETGSLHFFCFVIHAKTRLMRSVLRAVENSVGGWLTQSNSGSSSRKRYENHSSDSPIPESGISHASMDVACSENSENASICEESLRDKTSVDAVVVIPLLARFLRSVGQIHHLEEVSFHVYTENAVDVSLWNVRRLVEWILSLKFIGEDSAVFADILESECVDGACFLNLSDKDWEELHFDVTSITLLKCIRDGWLGAWGSPITVPRAAVPDALADGSNSPSFVPSYLSMSSKLRFADRTAALTGRGTVYGQLVTLGYREYRVSGKTWQPMGTSNDKFQLKRRNVSNGIRRSRAFSLPVTSGSAGTSRLMDRVRAARSPHCSHLISFATSPNEQVVLEYEEDQSRDSFQIGRMQSPVNDLLLRGPLHADPQGALCGPVSRFACRIECDRVAPFRCRLFACGFNENNEMVLPSSCPVWTRERSSSSFSSRATSRHDNSDALAPFGIRLWRPEAGCWSEVSVQGHAHGPRPHPATPGPRLDDPPPSAAYPPETMNELTDGCIIDVSGVLLLFQNHKNAIRPTRVDPNQLIRRLNGLKPQCPVLMHTIRFTYSTPRQRVAKAAKRLLASGDGAVPSGSFHVPAADSDGGEDDRRPFVFPACGHVHAFSKELQGRRCPLCRRVGPFVPLLLPFEPAVCSGVPTHVFNPCGHAAAKETCEFWSSLLTSSALPEPRRCRPICPFCACCLESVDNGGPFSRLVLQFEASTSLSSTLDAWLEGDSEDVPGTGDSEDKDEDKDGLAYSRDIGGVGASEDQVELDLGLEEEETMDMEDVEEERGLLAQQMSLRRQLVSSDRDEHVFPAISLSSDRFVDSPFERIDRMLVDNDDGDDDEAHSSGMGPMEGVSMDSEDLERFPVDIPRRGNVLTSGHVAI